MNICKTRFTIVAFIVIVELISVLAESSPSSMNRGKEDTDDYFYDSDIPKEEIDKMKKEKAVERERDEAKLGAEKPDETAPEWFERTSNESSDPMAAYMEQAIKEYMKKMQKEYMEKMKSKKKSEIDHSFWSVVTLSVFFGSGIAIGISIVLIRGRKFNKSSQFGNGANRRKSNGKNNSVKKVDYVSVPQNEKITI